MQTGGTTEPFIAHVARVAAARATYAAVGDLTYGDLWTQTARVATYLASSGVESGDRVSIFSENRVGFILAYLAVLRIGAIATRGRVVVVVQTLDPDEATFPFKETVRLESLEGNVVVETDEAARDRYLAALAELQESWRRTLVGRGASFLTMRTDEDPVAAVRNIIEAIR